MCLWYADGKTKMNLCLYPEGVYPLVETNVLFTRDGVLLEFQSKEALSKKKWEEIIYTD